MRSYSDHNVAHGGYFLPVKTSFRCGGGGWAVGTSFRSSEGAGEVEGVVVDDFAVAGHDGDALGSDFDDGGDVLVGVVFSDGDALSEQLDAPVGSDEADDFDTPLGWQPGGWLEAV